LNGGLASGLTPDDVLDGVLDDLWEENILQVRRKRNGVIKITSEKAEGCDSCNEERLVLLLAPQQKRRKKSVFQMIGYHTDGLPSCCLVLLLPVPTVSISSPWTTTL